MYYKDYLSIISKDNLCTFKEPLIDERTIKRGGVNFSLVFKDLHVKTKTSLNSFMARTLDKKDVI